MLPLSIRKMTLRSVWLTTIIQYMAYILYCVLWEFLGSTWLKGGIFFPVGSVLC